MNQGSILAFLGCVALLTGCTGEQQKNTPPVDRTIKMNDTAKKFNELADEWEQHCQKVRFSSRTSDYLNCVAYHKLVGMGRPAIPYIMERYRKETLPWWGFVLDEITGMKMIENTSNIDIAFVRQRYLEWWKNENKANEVQEK